MRVLVYTSLFPNKQEPNKGIFVRQRMFRFAGIPGNEIQVVAPVPYCPSWFRVAPWHLYSKIELLEYQDRIPVHHPRYPLVPKASMILHAFSLFLSSMGIVRRIFRAFPFDLIDGHYIYPDGLAAVFLAKAFKKPAVLSARGSDINQFSGFRTIRPMIRSALANADAIVSVCKAIERDMNRLGVSSDKITVIPNGVDTRKFFLMDRTLARRSLNIPPEKKIVLSVGSLIPRKGYHVLIEGIPEVLEKRPDVFFHIIGEGSFRKELAAQIRRLELEDRIVLAGEIQNEELVKWYNAADVFCLASSREGWANVLMEAMACGCPAVATNVYGAPEIVTKPEVGLLVERTPRALARALLLALSTEWDRSAIRDHVASRDWNVVAREVEKVFQKCMEGTAGRLGFGPASVPDRVEEASAGSEIGGRL